MQYAIKLLTALLLTEAIEVPVCMIFGIRKKQLLIVLLANLITNPLLNVIYGLSVLYMPAYSAAVLAGLEILAVLTEWRIYRVLTDAKRPFITSLTANAVSFGIGLVLMRIL